MLDGMIIEELARELVKAENERRPIQPITEKYPGITIDEAYRIQLEVVRIKEDRGEKIVGKKIGLTSKQMQELLGVYEPDYGHIMDVMMCFEDDSIDTSSLIQPKVEAEIAFVLKRDLEGPGVTAADVLRATKGVMPAIEVIDSRIEDWRIKIQDTVADNASIGRVVLGAKLTPVEGIDLRLIGLVFRKNGEIIATSAGAAVLGNPAQSVAWLANKLAEYGVKLRAGEIILSGSLISAVNVRPEDSIVAEFDKVGSVTVHFR
jgi:2-oxopent-4-enoate hydratase